VTALAHELARLIGPLHGLISAAGGVLPMDQWRGAVISAPEKTPSIRDRRGFKSGAAYTGGRPCSSMRAGCLE
jgi:hypothetical protein